MIHGREQFPGVGNSDIQYLMIPLEETSIGDHNSASGEHKIEDELMDDC